MLVVPVGFRFASAGRGPFVVFLVSARIGLTSAVLSLADCE